MLEKKAELSKRNTKQIMVIDYFISNPKPIERQKILSLLGISSSVIKSLVDKGILYEVDARGIS